MTKTERKLNIPKHIGFIMDGNRRWASERNLPTLEGHRKGYKVMKQLPQWFFERGVEIVSVYAFSTENWNRSRDEVNYLMKLLGEALVNDIAELGKNGVRIVFSGRTDELPGNLPQACQDAVDQTRSNNKSILNICLNYGGREEIIDVIKKIVKNNIEIDQIHEGMVRKYLYQKDLPDPDLIVRTSGEQRTSGFLLWEAAYSELLFLKKYWPEMEKSDVDVVLNDYDKRKRRFGV